MKPMNSKPYKSGLLLFCLLIVAACAISAEGQSGRKQRKAPPAAPVPTPTPEPTPAPKKEKDKESELGFIIAADNTSVFEVLPLSYYGAAINGCADRLRSGSSASVTVAQGTMNRSEAIKKAKAETSTYVVLIRLVLDQMYAKSYDDLEVDFTV